MISKSDIIQEALDVIDRMPVEDQMTVVKVLHHWLTEYRRSEMARNALDAQLAVREGNAHCGDIDDLKRDLNS